MIRTTLLSAALQEYPDKRVVLLIDDPYVPKTPQAREQLESARALPGQIERLLAEPARRFAGEMRSFELAVERGEKPRPELDGRAGQRLRRRGQLAGEPGRRPGDHRPHRRRSSSTRSCCGWRSRSARSGRRCSTRPPRASCCTRRCSAACTGGWRGRSAPG